VTAHRRILFIGGSSEPGGLHIHTADVARGLWIGGDDVAILNTSIDYFTQLMGGSLVGVQTVPLPQPSTRRGSFHSWRALLAPYQGWEMVLCRGTAGDTPLSALLAMRSRARRIFTIEHRPAEADAPGGFWRKLRCRLMGWLICRAVAVSEETRLSTIAGGYLAPQKVVTCLNWIDVPAFRMRADVRHGVRHHLGFSDNTVVLGYAGRLAPEKRIDVLIDAFAGLSGAQDIRLMLIGDGWKRAELQQQCQALGLGERVIFGGWKANTADSLAALDLFILPSLVEGFALSLLEAMAAGIPCLAHDMDSAREAIVDGKNGLLADFTTAEGMRAAIQRALALSQQERQAMGNAAAGRAAARFSRHLRLPAVLRVLEAEWAALAASAKDKNPQRRHFGFGER
jgi:glycosyltransferase involved in cell wall biosynthesis